MAYKLDIKDMRILNELDSNADIVINRLAKNVKVSQQVADYRMKNLMKDKVILSTLPLIDMGKLGYSLFRTHIRFKSISEEKRKKFEDHVFKNYMCFYIGAIGGKWDSYFDIFAKSPSEFQEKLSEIVSMFKEEIQEYETLTIIRIHVFNYKYLMNKYSTEIILNELGNEERIDEIDSKILLAIKTDSRTPYLRIADKVGLTRNAVKERLIKLHKRKVIVSDRLFLNPELMGKESYKLLFKLKGDEEQKKKLLDFARHNKSIIYALELMGSYQLDLEIEIENRKELQKLLIELRNKFPIIEDYEILSLFYDSGSDFYPIR